jgi:FkbM family methyltransferase
MRFLSKWSHRRRARLSHNNALGRLAAVDFTPRVVYDVGAYRGAWSKAASEVFSSAEFLLFEANADNEPYLAATGYQYFIAALSDQDGIEKSLFLPQAGDTTGTSLYVENTTHYADHNLRVRKVPTRRLDSVIAAHGLAPPDLMKIDVQGAELDVMSGATIALAAVSAVILETSFVTYNSGAPLIADLFAAVDGYGLKCVDVCELHRSSRGVALQMDLLFVKGPLFERFCSAACQL